MQLIAGGKSKGGALNCKHGGLREQEPAQPVAEGVQGAAGDGDAGAIKVDKLRKMDECTRDSGCGQE